MEPSKLDFIGGLALALLAAVLLYLASPRQGVLKRALPGWPSGVTAVVALVGAMSLMGRLHGVVPGFFAAIVSWMLGLVLMAWVGAIFTVRRGDRGT